MKKLLLIFSLIVGELITHDDEQQTKIIVTREVLDALAKKQFRECIMEHLFNGTGDKFPVEECETKTAEFLSSFEGQD